MEALRSLLNTASLELGVATVAAMVSVVAAAAAARALFTGRRSEVVERLERTVGRAEPSAERTATGEGFSLGKLLRPIARLARPTKAAELTRLRQRLIQGGYRGPLAVETFLALKLGIAAVTTIAFLQINKRLPSPLSFPMDMAVAVWLCGAGFL